MMAPKQLARGCEALSSHSFETHANSTLTRTGNPAPYNESIEGRHIIAELTLQHDAHQPVTVSGQVGLSFPAYEEAARQKPHKCMCVLLGI